MNSFELSDPLCRPKKWPTESRVLKLIYPCLEMGRVGPK